MLSHVIARARSLWRGVRRRGAVEAEMAEEFRLHLELRAADLVRAGLTPAAAARRARLEFGCAELHKDDARAARGLRRVDELRFSWLDLKLGFRMLARYPGLTIVGSLTMAFAIWAGAGTFELVTQVVRPTLPLPEGERLVGVRLWDLVTTRAEPHLTHDLAAWRAAVRSIEGLGASRTLERNLITADGRSEPTEVAEISASAFRVTRVSAQLGRTLIDDDERPGAPAVAVVGHALWQSRFGGDPAVVGRVVRLGRQPTTIVGVMPPGYGFPVAQSLWTPLRLDPLGTPPRQGPSLLVFGRLADGATLADARAELATVGARASAQNVETHEHLRPRVDPYASAIIDIPTWLLVGTATANLPVLLLLTLVCANVGLLMFARAATREAEIVVRSALGASRARIVGQLFAEALVLGTLAAAVGLGAAGFGLRWVMAVVEGEFLNGARLPFWFRPGLSPTTVIYVGVLTLLGAVVAGVVPALRVTRATGARLKQVAAGSGGLQFGGLWTVVIVAQIAVTVVFPVITLAVQADAKRIRTMDAGVPAAEFLSLRLEMDRDPPDAERADTSRAAFVARYRRAAGELHRRLAAEPGVAGVAVADRLPRMYHPHRLVDVDDGGAAPLDPRWAAYRVSSASVAPAYFDALGAPVLAGRGFSAADHATERGTPGDSTARGGPVIVNQSFVTRVLGGRNPVGRRLRYRMLEEWDPPRRLRDSDVWYEIVGVVRDLGMSVGSDPKAAGIYHPVPVGGIYPTQAAVHVRGDPSALAPRLRALAADVDPTLRLYDVRPLDRVNDAELEFYAFWFRFLLAVCAIALTLSLAGIYAVMSFTVARRTREIGVRVALGATAREIVLTTFARPLRQVGLGVFAGAAVLGLLLGGAADGPINLRWIAYLVPYSVAMAAVCLLACVVPVRRALRVQPTVALKADG